MDKKYILVFPIDDDSTRSRVFDILDGRIPLELQVGASQIMTALFDNELDSDMQAAAMLVLEFSGRNGIYLGIHDIHNDNVT